MEASGLDRRPIQSAFFNAAPRYRIAPRGNLDMLGHVSILPGYDTRHSRRPVAQS
jgi:hypothetical protein